MEVSVIICTYNRCGSLLRTLQSLEGVLVPADITWELIVVDNNSIDATKAVVEEMRRRSSLPLRYMFEKNQGVSFARNAGIMEAKGEIIAFTDDDCVLDEKWLMCLHGQFAIDRQVSGLGGRVELYNPEDKPVTIRVDKVSKIYSPLENLCQIFGANMALRRRVFESVGNFDVDLGPGGKLSVAAEDADMLYRAHKKGFKIAYVPELLVYHNHGRRTDSEVAVLLKGYARGRGAVYCKHLLAGDKDILKIAYWELRMHLRDVFRNLWARQPISYQVREFAGLFGGAIQVLKYSV